MDIREVEPSVLLNQKHLNDLRNIIKLTPHLAGVYIFYNNENYPLYIGKSVNIQQRLLSHFYAVNSEPSTARLFYQTQFITYEETAGELGALLLEAYLIKKYRPLFNKRLRRCRQLMTLKVCKSNDYFEVEIIPFNLQSSFNFDAFGLFSNRHQARQKLRSLIKKNQLCQFTELRFPKNLRPCFARQLNSCCGACERAIDKDSYNKKLITALTHLKYVTWPYSGKIAIKEVSRQSGKVQYHIIDNWIYLQSNDQPVFIAEKAMNDRLSFDRDYYLTLMRFFKNLDEDDIVEL